MLLYFTNTIPFTELKPLNCSRVARLIIGMQSRIGIENNVEWPQVRGLDGSSKSAYILYRVHIHNWVYSYVTETCFYITGFHLCFHKPRLIFHSGLRLSFIQVNIQDICLLYISNFGPSLIQFQYRVREYLIHSKLT